MRCRRKAPLAGGLVALGLFVGCASTAGEQLPDQAAASGGVVSGQLATPAHTATVRPTRAPSGIALEPPILSDVDTQGPITTDTDLATAFSGILPPVPIPSQTPAPTPTAVPSCAAFTLPGVEFDSGADTLTDEGRKSTELAYRDFLAPVDEVRELLIVGHTDSRPFNGPGGNQGLSERRAAAIEDEFRRLGLPAHVVVELVGEADRLPVALGDDPKSLALNRRVEVHVVC